MARNVFPSFFLQKSFRPDLWSAQSDQLISNDKQHVPRRKKMHCLNFFIWEKLNQVYKESLMAFHCTFYSYLFKIALN